MILAWGGELFLWRFIYSVANRAARDSALGFPPHAFGRQSQSIPQRIFWAIWLSSLVIISLMIFQAEQAAYTVRRLTHLAERLGR